MMPLNQTRNDKSKDHKFPVEYISNIFKFNDSLIHSQSGEFELVLSPNWKLLVKSERLKRIKKEVDGRKVDGLLSQCGLSYRKLDGRSS